MMERAVFIILVAIAIAWSAVMAYKPVQVVYICADGSPAVRQEIRK